MSSSCSEDLEGGDPRGDDEPTPTAEKLFEKGALFSCLVSIRVLIWKGMSIGQRDGILLLILDCNCRLSAFEILG